MSECVSGGSFKSESVSSRGEQISESFETGKDEAGTWQKRSDWMSGIREASSRGATFNLGKYSFARVEVRVSYESPKDGVEAALRQANAVVDEIIDREEAELYGRDRKPTSIDFKQGCVHIGVTLGLTIPRPNMESLKFDIGIDRAIDDAKPFGPQMDKLCEDVQSRVMFRRDEIMGKAHSSVAKRQDSGF